MFEVQHVTTEPNALDGFAPEERSGGVALGPRPSIAEIAPRRTGDNQKPKSTASNRAPARLASAIIAVVAGAAALGVVALLVLGPSARKWTRSSAARVSGLITEVRRAIGDTPAVAGSTPADPPPSTRDNTARRSRAHRSARPDARHTEVVSARRTAPIGQLTAAPLVADIKPMTPEIGDATGTVYSSTDSDVRPPELLYPQMPAPPGPHSGRTNQMELVISASGRVERVQLIAGPTRLPDMMLLSGAKMWKFKPATKDGHPVRYRTIVSWVGNP